MDLNLRHAIKSNINGNDVSQLQATIVDAIESGEEKMLPGLGVLFEIYWQQASEDEKQAVLKGLEDAVN
ncbi:small acid-soluble spore protein I (minor) [Gracilibacillus halotolerans]|uniref:Small, acid-soluble spore protein I n=1 Tax=Gracilibacillus halotolerans TaxID=74386 RepID=A0A841RPU7_9BACI|nr:small acid-soluble spore protein SspI [Gracilibacillus halotolerans]MBB6513877.1 small acid-soluble spore protein I (minor) [Gracilibacillus halotolerans]